MNIRLHKQARTTPAIRKEIQESPLSERALAEKYNISRATVHKWKHRDQVEDHSNRPHDIHAALSPWEELVAVLLRTFLLLPLDDLLTVVHVLLHFRVSRSALDRCLRRHGVSCLNTLVPRDEQRKRTGHGPGYVYIAIVDIPTYLTNKKKRSLYMAVDHASRWVHCAIKPPYSDTEFLKHLLQNAPFDISTVHHLSIKQTHHPADSETHCSNDNGSHLLVLFCRQRHITFRTTPSSWDWSSLRKARKPYLRWNLRHSKVFIEESCQFFNRNIALKVLGNHPPMQIIAQSQSASPASETHIPLPSAEEEELFQLREKNRRMRLEREVLNRERPHPKADAPAS
jgi:hypothetical protein